MCYILFVKILKYLLIVFLLFSGCSSVSFQKIDERQIPQKVDFKADEYTFLYPEKGKVSLVKGEGSIDFSAYGNYSCSVIDFGDVEQIKSDLLKATEASSVEISKLDNEDTFFESWYLDSDLVFYSKFLSEDGFGFWAFDDFNSVVSCMPFVDEVFDSLSSDLEYVNEDFGFSVKIPKNFKVEYLENGILLKRWIEPSPVEDTGKDEESYKLEIVVWPIGHPDTEEELSTYIGQKYPGYSIDAEDFVGFSGFFVDESAKNLDAIRHFFAMNRAKDVIYEIYMTVPGQNYDENKEFFDDFIKSNFKIF